MKAKIRLSLATCVVVFPFGISFECLAADVTSTWSAATTGDWADDANWNNVPGPDVFPNNGASTYDAVIDAAGIPYSVTLATIIEVEALTLNSADATLDLQGGTLTANSGISVAGGVLYFNGGTLLNTTVTPAGGSVLFSGGSNRLDGSTLTGDLLLNQAAAHHVVRLQNGASFSGDATLGTADGYQGILSYEQTGTLNGKTLNFDPTFSSGAYLAIDGDNTLTFGPTLVARGAAVIGQQFFVGGTSTLVNQGLISSDLAGLTTTINPSIFTNNGIAEAINGATLTVQPTTSWTNDATGTIRATGAESILNFHGSYTNAGNIELTDSTLNLHGTFTTTALGVGGFTRSGSSVVNIIGDMDNTGNTFALNATTGDWTMANGRIIGGTITESGGAKLLFSGGYYNRLDGVTFTGDLLLNQPTVHQYLRLQNGTTFTGNAHIGSPDGYQGVLSYEQTGTLNGKTLNFDPTFSSGAYLAIDGDNTLTFGPTLVARGAAVIGQQFFVGGTSTLVNQGLISSDLAGLTTTINPSIFTNQGIAEAINGATLTVQATDWTNDAAGTIRATGPDSILNFYGNYSNAGAIELTDAILNLHGTFSTAGLGFGGITRSGTTEINLHGDLENTGETLAINATTGDINLVDGRIIGGTITETGGAKLRFTGSNGRLDGVTFTGDLLMNQPGTPHYVRLQNGSTFSGDAYLGTPDGFTSVLGFEQTTTLDNKTLNFDSAFTTDYLTIDGDNTLTFGPNLTARGTASIGQAFFVGGTTTLINNGLMSADLAGRTMTVNPSIFTNNSIAEAINGATLTIQAADWTNGATGTIRATGPDAILNFHGNYSNAGSIQLTDAILNLHGTFTTTGLGIGAISRSGVTQVNIIGNMANTGGTFALTAATGDWNLAGGSITGGTITEAGGARLRFPGYGNRLDNATLMSALRLDEAGGSYLRLQNGAGFTGNASIGTPDGSSAILGFEQTLTLDNRTLNFDPAFGNAILTVEGDNTLTLGPNLVARGGMTLGGQYFVGGTATLVNQGLISADNPTVPVTISPSIFTNSGILEARNGATANVQPTTLTNLPASTLTGGSWRVFADSQLWIYYSSVTSNAAEIVLNGANSLFYVTPSQTPLEDVLTGNTSSGVLRILGGRNYATNAFSNAGIIELGGGTYTPTTLTNPAGSQFFGFGDVAVRPTNSGTIRSAGGTLAFSNGVLGSGGTVQTDAASTMNLSTGAATGSSADFLIQNGNLTLGSKTFTVGNDYTNANFGTGNTFAPRANISGSGSILAVGGSGQTLSGNVTSGGTAAPLMAFGNLHVGSNAIRNYQINNTGASGSRLRGARQTTVNGGNLTDARLSGSGVTAGNFGPILPAGNSGSLPVTFTASSAGSLTGQTVRILNNFDNVANQTLTITGAAYRHASPSAHTPEPVAFGKFHVGATLPSQVLTLSNTAANDGFSESLNAGFSGTTGGANSNGGSFTGLTAGSSNGSALAVSIGTGSAGSKNGTATIALTSNGSGSSGLGLTPLASQTVNVTGAVYRYALPSLAGGTALAFGIVHVGDLAQQTVGVTNSVPNDGFSESLNASFSGNSGDLVGSGSFAALAPGSSSTAPKVTLDTATAGPKAGTATLAVTSNGTGSSGLANTPLTAQVISATGQVNNHAAAVIAKDSGAATLSGGTTTYSVAFGRRTIGESPPTVTLRVTNSAAAPSDTLAGSFATAAPDFTLTGFGAFSGIASGQSQTNLVIALQTDTLGNFNQTVTLNGLGQNGSGYSGALGPITINLTGEIAEVPQLKIQLSGPDAILSWPLAEQGWILKKSGILSGWTPVAQPVVDTPTEHTVTTPRGLDTKLFFRLEK